MEQRLVGPDSNFVFLQKPFTGSDLAKAIGLSEGAEPEQERPAILRLKTQGFMSDQELLTAAKVYCDPDTGEVVKKIPAPLMRKLRDAKLARGIRGKRTAKTDTTRGVKKVGRALLPGIMRLLGGSN